jgi:hypothetical protein
MEAERRRRRVLHRQARESVYKVFSYCKRETDAGMPVHDVAKAQERTAEAWDIRIRSVQRIISEGNAAICISPSLWAEPASICVGHFTTATATNITTTTFAIQNTEKVWS